MAQLCGFDLRLQPRRQRTLAFVLGVPNLWLATGHGTLGWTMAAGTARLLADWMSGREPAIDTEGLTLARYAGGRIA